MTARDFQGARPTYEGEILALHSDRELPEDTNSETDPITDYPLGVSVMGVSAVADWNEDGVTSVVTTHRIGAEGWQSLALGESTDEIYIRHFGGVDWSDWQRIPTLDDIAVDRLYPLPVALAESDALSSYPDTFSFMSVSGAANWGPNTGQAGHVVTERSGSNGKQTFHQYSNATSYERTYTSSAWGSWRNTKDADLLDGNDSAFFATATGLSDHIGDASDAHDASAISILDSANQYSATNAEDALAEVLDALQAHEADTTDAHDASAISYAGGTGMSATNVEAAVDELATEKLDTLSYTAADVLSKLLTVDTNTSGLNADTLDGLHGADLAAAGHTHSGLAPTGGTTNQVLKKNSNTNYDYSWAADATGAGGSGGSGEATLDFGAFPGKTDATIAVTGQTDIVSGSLVQAWVMPEATVEHSADEHWVDPPAVLAGNVAAATGFTIYGRCQDKQRLYGRYNIAWRWS